MKTFLLSWAEWTAIREDNARKRAVRSALAGTGTPLPGSYAACPSTNPRAMDSVKKTGLVTKQPFRLKVEVEHRPDYSFDRWIKQAQEFGDDVNAMVGHAKEEEKDLDKKKEEKEEKEDKEKETKKVKSVEKSEPLEKPEPEPKEDKAKKDSVWTKFKQLHQEKMKNQKTQGSKDSQKSS